MYPEDAEKITIKNAILEIATTDEEKDALFDYLKGFRTAWKAIKGLVMHHRTSITPDIVDGFHDGADSTPLVYFLPYESGKGLCSLALSDFLHLLQNEIISLCNRSLRKYLGVKRTPLPLVHVKLHDVVVFEEEIDSVVLAHCQYSLAFGKGQEVTYNYSCLLYTSPSPRDRQKSRMPSSA